VLKFYLINRLLRTFSRERALIRSLVELGLAREQAIEFVMHPVHSGLVDPSLSNESTKARKGTMLGSAKHFVLDTDTETNVGAETLTYNIPPKWNDLLDGLVDSSDRLEGGGVVVWWNDIEEDTRYTSWGTDLTQVGICAYLRCSLIGDANFISSLLPA
jgi:UDP-glucose:glycoprotein glucosyltransferase